jgi:hypothetical protein
VREGATHLVIVCISTRSIPTVLKGDRFQLRDLSDQSCDKPRTGCRGHVKVSNELSNYCGANRQPRLDDPGTFGASGIGIDDHLACFTPKRSETYVWFLRIASRTLL